MNRQKEFGIINFETEENVYYDNGKNAYYYKDNFLYTTQEGNGYLIEGIKKINMSNGEEEYLIEIIGEENFYEEVRFSKDDKNFVALERENKKIDIYDLESKELIKTISYEDRIIDDFEFAGNHVYVCLIERDKENPMNVERFILKEKVEY